MNRALAVLQVGLALILFVTALATLVNMVLITMQHPESISVVNTIIGQTVIIVCLVALGRILLKKGLAGYSSEQTGDDDQSVDDQHRGA